MILNLDSRIEGCEGDTTCGNRGFGIKEAANNGVMATFTFSLRTGNELEIFSIENTGQRSAKNVPTTSDRRAGCGRSITWSSMAPVTLPPELAEAVVNVNTEDMSVVPKLLQLNVDLPYTIDLNLTLIPRLFFFSNFLILFRS